MGLGIQTKMYLEQIKFAIKDNMIEQYVIKNNWNWKYIKKKLAKLNKLKKLEKKHNKLPILKN